MSAPTCRQRRTASTCLDGARSTGIDDDGHRLCLPRDAFDDSRTTGHLLNCTNGVLDLTTGVLRSHEDCKQLFITKLCPVAYRPEAQCPLWLNTLDQIFEADVDPERARDLIEVLQFALGYSLSGEQSHHVVILLYGPEGRNGKSLIVRITLRILGRDYAMQAPPGLLRVKRGETHPTELADLHGRRFVATVETGRGEKLDEGLVKQLSGGDRVKARRMREDFWEFEPTHHLWLATNALPRADSSDQALFTRFRVVPFRRRFLKPGDDGYENCAEVRRADDTLESRILASEQEGVLAWAVRGNQGYRKVGAVPNPQASQDATAEYRDENDPLVEWIEEQCETAGTDARDRLQLGSPWTETADLYASYVGWKNRRNEKPISSNLFGRTLTAKGFPDARRGHAGTHGRLGIQLRCPAGQQPEMPGEEEVPF